MLLAVLAELLLVAAGMFLAITAALHWAWPGRLVALGALLIAAAAFAGAVEYAGLPEWQVWHMQLSKVAALGGLPLVVAGLVLKAVPVPWRWGGLLLVPLFIGTAALLDLGPLAAQGVLLAGLAAAGFCAWRVQAMWQWFWVIVMLLLVMAARSQIGGAMSLGENLFHVALAALLLGLLWLGQRLRLV